MKNIAANAFKFSRAEVGLLAQSLSSASRPLRAATKSIVGEYRLGTRGARVLLLIERKLVAYPLDMANHFHVGRSAIMEELVRLAEAGLITYRKSDHDRRRVELVLTPLGRRLTVHLRRELTKLMMAQSSSYPREDVLRLSQILHDFIFWDAVPSGGQS